MSIHVVFFDLPPEGLRHKYAVIIAWYQGRLLWCRHEARTTWEIPAGRSPRAAGRNRRCRVFSPAGMLVQRLPRWQRTAQPGLALRSRSYRPGGASQRNCGGSSLRCTAVFPYLPGNTARSAGRSPSARPVISKGEPRIGAPLFIRPSACDPALRGLPDPAPPAAAPHSRQSRRHASILPAYVPGPSGSDRRYAPA